MKSAKVFTYTIWEDGTVLNRHEKRIAIQIGNSGYKRVELHENGKATKHLLHRLLALCFIPNPMNKPCVNHMDGDKLNNSLDNLEWVSRSENQVHAYRTGLQVGYKKPTPLSPSHKLALCGSRWFGESRIYVCGGREFKTPEEAAAFFLISRQTVYNRAASKKFPDWSIIVRREVK